jgi:hypothetical protein
LNVRRIAGFAAMCLPLALSGCALFPIKRKLPVPKVPSITQTIAPEDLVARLNQRWNALNSLFISAEIAPSKSNSREGSTTDYPSLWGHVLLRKPGSLHVLGQLLGLKVFDMVTDGNEFKLYIPSRNKVIEGSNAVKAKSANALENLRPDFFLDAMLVRGLEANDKYMVTTLTMTVEDTAKRHLLLEPEYILTIMRPDPMNGPKMIPVRDVHFHRDDLLPYQQNIYDATGNLETQVFYSLYQDFNGARYPSSITIKRPVEEIQVVLTVQEVIENPPLKDDQFTITGIYEGTTIQKME